MRWDMKKISRSNAKIMFWSPRPGASITVGQPPYGGDNPTRAPGIKIERILSKSLFPRHTDRPTLIYKNIGSAHVTNAFVDLCNVKTLIISMNCATTKYLLMPMNFSASSYS